MPTEDLVFQITVNGADAATGALGNISVAVKRTTDELRKNSDANKSAGDSANVAGTKFNTFGSTMGLAGQAVGRFNPILGQTVAAAGQASGVIQTLTTAGLGPFGIAIGIASAAVAILAPLIASLGEDATTASTGIDDLTKSLDDYVSAANRAAAQIQLTNRLRSATGEITEQQGFVDQGSAYARVAEGRAATAVGRFNRARFGQSTGRFAESAEQILARTADGLSERNAQLLRETQSAILESARAANVVTYRQGLLGAAQEQLALNSGFVPVTPGTTKPPSRGGGGRGGGDSLEAQQAERRRATLALEAKIREEQQRTYEEAVSQINRQNESERLAAEERIQMAETEASLRQKLADDEAAQAERLNEKRTQNIEEQARIQREAQEKIKEAWSDTWTAGTNTLNAFGDAAGSALSEALAGGGNLAQGFATFIDQKLAALAISETVEGLGSLAVAIGNSIFNPPLAASKYAESALHFAAAGAAGGISAAIPGGAGSGGGGGETRPDKNSSSSGGGGATIIINQGGNVITAATRAQLGREQANLINDGLRLRR